VTSRSAYLNLNKPCYTYPFIYILSVPRILPVSPHQTDLIELNVTHELKMKSMCQFTFNLQHNQLSPSIGVVYVLLSSWTRVPRPTFWSKQALSDAKAKALNDSRPMMQSSQSILIGSKTTRLLTFYSRTAIGARQLKLYILQPCLSTYPLSRPMSLNTDQVLI
jgi:hypothetical protein